MGMLKYNGMSVRLEREESIRMRTEEIRLSFQGLRVRFRVFTPDAQATRRVLMVSSPLADADAWTELAGMLAANGCLCVAAELPGYGASACGAGVFQDNDTRAQILWGILDEVERRRGEKQCVWHLIGHGSAAAAIMMMTLYQADSVKSRVLISPVFDRFMPYPLQRLLETPVGKKLIDFWFRKKILDRRGFAMLVRRVYGGRVSKTRMEVLRRSICRRGMPATLTRLMREGYRLPEKAYQSKGPLMLIWGTNDRIFGGQLPVRIKKRLPDAETHMLRAAHMSMETDADILNDYLRGWFLFSEGQEKWPVKKPAVPQKKR